MGSGSDGIFLSRYDRPLPGVKRTLAVATPPAGSPWSIAVPGGRQWRIRAVMGTFTASAAILNREVGCQVTDGNATIYRVTPAPNQVAGQVLTYTFVPQFGTQTSAGLLTNNLVPVFAEWLLPGYVVSSFHIGIDAADAWSGVSAAIEEVFLDDTALSDELYNAADDATAQRRMIGR